MLMVIRVKKWGYEIDISSGKIEGIYDKKTR
jgi:hypothetical protein